MHYHILSEKIYTFLKLLSIIHVPMSKVHEKKKKKYKKRGYKYLTLLKIERIEYYKIYDYDSAMNVQKKNCIW